MEPRIDGTEFGSITIQGKEYGHDVIIRLDGQVKKRKKKLSKAVYGTSHTISLQEIEFVYQKPADQLIVGSGQYGMVALSDRAAEYLDHLKCQATLLPTPEAVHAWNQAEGRVIGLFHVTC